MTIEEEWMYHHRYELQTRHGAGTYVAVYDWAVIDWGDDPDAVRARAEATVCDTVFVGPVPADSTDVYPTQADHDAFRAYRERLDAEGDKRRYRIRRNTKYESTIDAYHAIGELDIVGKTEFVDGVVILDGIEKRYADHDYRLMVEHGIVPKDTELIAGVIFWRKPQPKPEESP